MACKRTSHPSRHGGSGGGPSSRGLNSPLGLPCRLFAWSLVLALSFGFTFIAPHTARAETVQEIIRKVSETLSPSQKESARQEASSPEALSQSIKAHVDELQKKNEAEKDSILKSLDDLEKELDGLNKTIQSMEDERRRSLLTETAGVLTERRKLLRGFLRLLDDEVKTAKDSLQALVEKLRASGAQPPSGEERQFFNFSEAEVAGREARIAEGKVELIRARLGGLAREQMVVKKEAEALRWQLQESQGRLKELQQALQGPPQVAGKPVDLELLKLEVQKASQTVSLRQDQSRFFDRRLHLIESQKILAEQEQQAAAQELEAKDARAAFVRSRTIVTPEEAEQAAKQKEKAEAQIRQAITALERERDRTEDEKVALERQLDRRNEAVLAAKKPEERETAESALQVTKLKLSLVDRQATRLAEEISLREEQLELERSRFNVVRQKGEVFQGKMTKGELREAHEKVDAELRSLRQNSKAQETRKEIARQASEQADAGAKVAAEKLEVVKKSQISQPTPNGSRLLSLVGEEVKVHQELAQVAQQILQVQTERERVGQERIKVSEDWSRFLASRLGEGWALIRQVKSAGEQLSHWITDFAPYLKVLAVFIIGFLLAKLFGRVLEHRASERVGKHVGKVGGRVVYYAVLFLTLVIALSILNIELKTVLAAAGVLTIAIGFAAQTTLGNMISGLMLLGDRPFQVEDYIEVEDKSGFVVSIDLLSTKLRTLDNTLVRIPNETLIKSTVRNVTRYDIRRIDIEVGVTYFDDLEKTQKVLEQVARQEVLVLEEPRPVALAQRFSESSIDFTLRTWVPRKQFFAARSNLVKRIKRAFDEQGITIAFPHRTLYIAEVPEISTTSDGLKKVRPDKEHSPPPPTRGEDLHDTHHQKGKEEEEPPDMD